MPYHVPPPHHPRDPHALPAPHFVDIAPFGFNPRASVAVDAEGKLVAPDAENPPPAIDPVGPPDLLADLAAELEALEREADAAFWSRRPGFVAGRTVARLNAINAVLAPLLAADPPHKHDAIALAAAPAGIVLGVGELRAAIRGARRAARWLIARRRRRHAERLWHKSSRP